MPRPLPPASARPSAAEEGAWVEQARTGDRDAFDRLATAAMPMLIGTALRLLGDRLAAEEAVAEALYRAYRKLDGFDGRSRFSTWVHRILCRAAADRVRDRAREQSRRRHLASSARTRPAATVAEHLAADEKGRRIRTAVEDLPPTQRLVILLAVWEGLSLHDVARVAGIRYRTAKSNLNHARNALRRILGEEATS